LNRFAILLSSSLGLAAILRAATFYAGVDSLALALVLLMAFVLVAATLELAVRTGRFEALDRELRALPAPASAEAVSACSPALRVLLRGRIEHIATPTSAPSFAPYVVGLLVMLGLLGTFLGLFETLRGAREALASSTDVDALRSGLARPMLGLTRSFGTSAAGVSSSAALGLALVFARRSEARFVRSLQVYAAGPLARLTVPQRTLAALEALVAQGESLPRAATSLEDATSRLARLETTWRDAHASAASETARAIAEATRAVGASLDAAVVRVGPATREVLEPLVRESIAGTTGVVAELVATTARAIEDHVGEVRRAHAAHAEALEARHEADAKAMRARDEEHVEARRLRDEAHVLAVRARDEEHVERLQNAMAKLVDAERERASVLAAHWDELSVSMSAASEKVHAAAGTAIGEGHEQIARLVVRHEELGARVDTLVRALGEASASSARIAEERSTRLDVHAAELAQQLSATARVVGESADLLRAGGGELGAVAEAFGVAVDRHRDASTAWLESLGAIDVAVEQASERVAAGALSETLTRMHEAFERQVQIELELFTQLRALRGLPPPPPPQEHRGKTDAPA
jgi:hypothetical protein